MVEFAEFIEDEAGNISISPYISIKLCDFGVAEIFDKGDQTEDEAKIDEFDKFPFQCYKSGLTVDNEASLSPKQFKNEVYDGRAADVWSLGLILFECMTNTKLYHEATNTEGTGFWAIQNDKLKQYVKMNDNLSKYFNRNSLSLLCQLLKFDEQKRISGMNILKHSWFKIYFRKYQQQIVRKMEKDGKSKKKFKSVV